MSSTPTLAVHDNRGAAVRTVQYNRRLPTDTTKTLITHSQLPDGALEAQLRDPRLFTAWQSGAQAANLVTRTSLSGQGLRRDSSDSGSDVTLFDAEGRAVWQQDARGTVTQVSYDRLSRPVNCQQQASGGTARTAQVYFYGDANAGSSTESLRGDNLLGQCLRGYDEGGALFTDSVALSGAVLRSSSQLPVSAEQEGDWQGSESSWQTQLDPTVYVTTMTAGAAGQALTQMDAAGHVTTLGYDAGGLQVSSSLTLSDGTHIALLNGLTYSAAGQPLSETAGNGVVTTYGYQPQTQRLSALSAVRSTDKVQLQGLGYAYDAVGNVLRVTDSTVSAGYFRNQATDGSCSFTYDALYQLVEATGRENAGKAAQTGDLPVPVTPVPANDAKYSAYTRAYNYDDSGNLSSLTHSGSGQGYSLDMVTESTSNRSVQQDTAKSITPAKVNTFFDAAGNLQSLQAKASPAAANGLTWDEDNRLRAVVLMSRSATDMSQNDREVYQYRDGMRVRKQTRRLTNSGSGLWTVDEVRYLGGVELRSTYQETVKAGVSTPGAVSEALEVVTAQAGRSQIRVLHWTTGRPSAIANNQARYSVDDHTGSLMLELDGTGQIISREEYYPYGGTAVWAVRSEVEAAYKTVRYSGKERDGTGLYYYGYRYYAPWLCRWLNADPAREVDGLNLYRMVRNNPVTNIDASGLLIAGERARRIVAEKFVTPLHQEAIERISLTHNMALSFREAGAPTIAALEAGQAAKGHNILEKTIKPGSVNNAYGNQGAGVLDTAKQRGLIGSVGQWGPRRTGLTGVYVHNTVTHEDLTFPVNLGASSQPELLNELSRRGRVVTYTGDYDMHDIIIFDKNQRGHIPKADSAEERNVKDLINREVSGVDSARPFEQEHINVVRHGPQVNFVEHMMNEELSEVVHSGGYLGVVAKPGPFPVAMVHRGKWQILENENELYSFYNQLGVELPPHWGNPAKTPLIDRGNGIVSTDQHASIIKQAKSVQRR